LPNVPAPSLPSFAAGASTPASGALLVGIVVVVLVSIGLWLIYRWIVGAPGGAARRLGATAGAGAAIAS